MLQITGLRRMREKESRDGSDWTLGMDQKEKGAIPDAFFRQPRNEFSS
jgi:hypothetical protein